jgi:Cu(I)/Ag(I) efflux system membrane protein CusA/SilA
LIIALACGHRITNKGDTNKEIEEAAVEGAVPRLRPKLLTFFSVLASLVPMLWEGGIGSDVMRPVAAPIVGGMITSTIHLLILVPVSFVMMKERALRRNTLHRWRKQQPFE